MIVTFEVIDHIVRAEALLVRVERFLRGNGHAQLADALDKLQQDAGLKYFNDIGNGLGANEETGTGIDKVRDFIGDEDLEATAPLLAAYEEIAPGRLQVFSLILEPLRGQNSILEADYSGFMRELERLAAFPPSAPAVSHAKPRDFSP